MRLTSTVKLLSLLLLFVFGLTSCLDGGDDDKQDDPAPEVSCVITRMNTSWNNAEQTYTYNAKGNIIALTSTSNGTTRVRAFTYDTNDRMVKEEISENGVLQEYIVFTYTNGLISRREWFDAANQLKYYQINTYNANGRLTEFTRDRGSYVDRVTMTYTAEGNVASQTTYRNGSLAQILTYENYDDKKNYQTATKGLQLSGVSANKNNFRKLTQVLISSTGSNTYVYLYELTYNEQGYPIREVEKTSEGEQYTVELIYQCK